MSFLDHRRRAISIAAAGLTVAFLTGCSSTSNHDADVPANNIAFAVDGHGTADITWTGGTVSHATLPWHTTVSAVAPGQSPSLTVLLDHDGGQARCTIAVNGRQVAGSLAQGSFGRANCRIPAADNTPQSDG